MFLFMFTVLLTVLLQDYCRSAKPSKEIPTGTLLPKVFLCILKLSLEPSPCAFVVFYIKGKVWQFCFTNMLLCVLYFASLHFMWFYSVLHNYTLSMASCIYRCCKITDEIWSYNRPQRQALQGRGKTNSCNMRRTSLKCLLTL